MAELLALKVLLPALLGGAIVSMLIERLLTPTPSLQRPAATWMLHFGMWLLAFAFELSLFRRPWFAAAFVLAFLLFVVLVSNAKFKALREPFIFSDFEYFTDALRHPRLYIAFLGWWRAVLAVAGFGAAVYLGLMFEAALPRAVWVPGALLIAALGLALIAIGALQLGAANFNPIDDLQRLGLIGSLWRYMADERKPIDRALIETTFASASSPPHALANIVVVQSESFFDARRVFSGIDRQVLANWDALQKNAAQYGRLKVAAWGANTVRTEFSFLSGLAIKSLGVHQFNPYRKLARELAQQGIATLASHLRKLGYRTVCVHPYPASFYNRHIVFPQLGFDEFIDIKSFDGAVTARPASGPYIGDVAVAKKITALLDATDKPLFVFAITMENHGPLHWETLSDAERQSHFTAAPPAGCDDLAVYLRHLANADKMFAILREKLAASLTPAWLCVYGDHVPIMSGVYAALGEPDGDTEYVLWRNRGAAPAVNRDLGVEALAAALLENINGVQSSAR